MASPAAPKAPSGNTSNKGDKSDVLLKAGIITGAVTIPMAVPALACMVASFVFGILGMH